MKSNHLNSHRIYTGFKYLVYVLLAANVWFFFADEWSAAQLTDASGFSATIDTAAWVILLSLFELETSLISDQSLKAPRVKYSLHAVRTVSYAFILFAFNEYHLKAAHFDNLAEMPLSDFCSLLGAGWLIMTGLDVYKLLDGSACASLGGQIVYAFSEGKIIVEGGTLLAAQRLAWVDIINAGAWILVVVILEFDVQMQLRNKLHGGLLTFSKLVKPPLYLTLFLAAAYWGLLGDFLDFWDAFLWLVAFIFIEMNLLQWNSEST